MATDEDLLEAEWESVADGSSDMNLAPNSDAASSNEPVLNQDEIDSLLGLDETMTMIS